MKRAITMLVDKTKTIMQQGETLFSILIPTVFT